MKEKSEIKNEVKITVDKLLNALSNKNLLLKNQYPDVYEKLILDRHKITIQMMMPLFKLRGITINQKFPDSVKHFGFDEDQIILLPWIVELQHLLGSYEMLKRSLLDIVDLEKIPNLRPNPTLGEIIGKLNQILKEDFFKNFIDKELRNALGHDNWWIEDRLIFCYRTKKPEPKKLTSEQFTDIVTKHSSFTSELYGAYSQNYCTQK